MRRSRALVSFGSVLLVPAFAAFAGRSHAADAFDTAADDVVVSRARSAAPPALLRTGYDRATQAFGTWAYGRFLEGNDGHSMLLAPSSGEMCPSDMVGVEGDYCPVVEQTCLRWIDHDTRLRCEEFARAAGLCSTKTRHQRFCIDRYEWPNEMGALPRYMTSWTEAKASCENLGKRLCSDTEWTLACEGPERRPYPYGNGYARDDRACNIDKPYIWPHPEKIYDPKAQSEELARLDQREPSGARGSCVSPYGVHDMVGNVDEWVVNESQSAKPFRSGLKGGYWGPVRTRCRPMTTAHDESFRYYQIGFRCCGEARLAPVDAAHRTPAQRGDEPPRCSPDTGDAGGGRPAFSACARQPTVAAPLARR